MKTNCPIIAVLMLMVFGILFSACEADEKEIPAPTIYLKMPENGYELEVNDTLIIQPKITYDYNSAYAWYHNDELISTELNLKHISRELGRTEYRFMVENPQGVDSMTIPVSTIILINFNDFELERGSYNIGLTMPPEQEGFVTKGAIFPRNAPSEEEWTGFGLSNIYSQSSTGTPSLYSAYAPTTATNNFMIYHQPATPYAAAFYFEDQKERVISSMSVANSTLGFLVMRYGITDVIRPFGGENNNLHDWFILTIEGYNRNGQKTGEINFNMADYTFENRRRNYIVSNWSTIKLDSLNAVNRVVLSLSSSITDDQGRIMTPPYLCIDNIKIVE